MDQTTRPPYVKIVLGAILIFVAAVLIFYISSKETDTNQTSEMTDEQKKAQALENLTALSSDSAFTEEERVNIQQSLTSSGDSGLTEAEREKVMKSLTSSQP